MTQAGQGIYRPLKATFPTPEYTYMYKFTVYNMCRTFLQFSGVILSPKWANIYVSRWAKIEHLRHLGQSSQTVEQKHNHVTLRTVKILAQKIFTLWLCARHIYFACVVITFYLTLYTF